MRNTIKPWLFVPGFLAIVVAFIRYTLELAWDAASNSLVGCGVFLIAVSIILNWKETKRFYEKRSTVYLTFSIVSVVVMLAILTMINFIVFLHPRKLDLTQNKFFTLSEQTTKLLAGLKKDISVLAFYKEGEQDGQLDFLTREYRSLNRHFSFRFVDPDRDPTLAQRYGVSKYKTVVMESGGKRLRVDEPNESGLTNSILKLIQDNQLSAYFVTGHLEHNFDSSEREGYSRAKQALEETNYAIKLLNLSEVDTVPADCATLIITGPKRNPTPQDLGKLESYLNGGGGLLLLLDPEPGVGFDDFLESYGVKVGNDVVIDASGAGRTIGAGPEVPLIRSYGNSEITNKFMLATFYPRTRSLTPLPKAPGGIQVRALMATSRSSWGETELGPSGGGARYDEGKDLPGPLALAVQITKSLGQPRSGGTDSKSSLRNARIVVFGDSDFATNAYFNAQGNGDMFINCVNWLAGQSDIIAIRPKKPENKRLTLSAQSNTVVFYVCVLLMPAIPLTAGLWVLVKRWK